MYKKKLGMKAITAITAAALLSSNVFAAAAQTQAAEGTVAEIEAETESSEEETEDEEATEEATEETTEEVTEEATEETTEEVTEEATEETTEEATENTNVNVVVKPNFAPAANAALLVDIEKISTDVTMNIQFKDGDEVIAGGDYTVPSGVQNYSVLAQYVPEGYEMTVSGDFMAEEGGKLEVNVEKVATEVIMNIQFKDGDEVVAGGDYFVPEGIQNYSVLEKYVPEGYQMAVSGDFMAEEGGHLEVRVEKIEATIINVVFEDSQGNNVGGGDCFVDADGDGIFNYSELDSIIPEGYKLVVTGDAFVSDFAEGGTVLKVVRDGATIINVVFVDSQGNNLGGGDYFVDEDGDGIFNYSELILPEGYKLKVTGDAFVNDFAEPGKDITLLRDGATIIHVVFVDKDGNNLGGDDCFVDEDGDGIFNYSELESIIPDGYELIVTGDAFVNAYLDATITLNEIGGETPEPEPETQTVTVSYIDQETNKTVGTAILTFDADVDEIDPSKLTVPKGYKLVSTEAVAIENNEATVYVKSTSTTTPDDPDQPENPGQGGGSHSSGGSSGGGSAVGRGAALTNGEWILDSTGWWYKYSNGTYAKSGWYTLEWQNRTDWYFFDDAGYLVCGWLDNNGNRYFLHDVHDGTFGRMYKGWNKIAGQWYYFNDTVEGTEGALVPDAPVPAELANQ